MTKIWLISDSHNRHEELQVPSDVDAVIHCGDATTHSQDVELKSFFNWMSGLPINHKIFIPGNHDYSFWNIQCAADLQAKYPMIEMLLDRGYDLEGISIWGAHTIGKYKDIPEGLDILISHYPPLSILDIIPPHSKFNRTHEPIFVGVEHLLDIVIEKKPANHFFGHIHEFGQQSEDFQGVHFINAALMDEYYNLRNTTGIVLEINK